MSDNNDEDQQFQSEKASDDVSSEVDITVSKKRKKFDTNGNETESDPSRVSKKSKRNNEKSTKNNEKSTKNKEKSTNNNEKSTKNEAEEDFMRIGEVKPKVLPKVSRSLPHWIENPEIVSNDIVAGSCELDDVKFLDKRLIAALKDDGKNKLFPVQQMMIPKILFEDKVKVLYHPLDFCIAASTGSGKTLAYALPVLQVLAQQRMCGYIGALVVVPDAHLASQVYKVFSTYCSKLEVTVGSATSSKSFLREQKELTRPLDALQRQYEPLSHRTHESRAHIVVGTPARIRYHMKLSKGFDLSQLRFLVLDEVNALLNSDQSQWISSLISHVKTAQMPSTYEEQNLPVPWPFQKLLVSATLTSDPEKLCSLDLYAPRLFKCVGLPSKMDRPPSLKERYCAVDISTQPVALHHLITKHGWKRVVVFHTTKQEVHRLVQILSELSAGSYTVAEFSSKHSMNPKKVEAKFNDGEIDVLVATDNLAQGTDLVDVAVVVNYSKPSSMSTYVHRIGRTARAGSKGMAVTLLPSDKNRDDFTKMAKRSGSVSIKALVLEKGELEQYEEQFKQAKEKMAEIINEERYEEKGFSKLKVKKLKGRNKSAKL